MATGVNNQRRLFSETISLDAWRSPFDGKRGEADLHIDVVFSDRGRVGGSNSPVRFRLSLRRAEVHVIRDSGGVIAINRKSILRPRPNSIKEHIVTERKTHISGAGDAGLSLRSAQLALKGKASSDLNVTRESEHTEDIFKVDFIPWNTENGYAFIIRARPQVGRLEGQPWSPEIPVMKIRDSNRTRKRGEPPEVRIEIRCLREDLIIEDVEFTASSFPAWVSLPRKKQIAVEQYIKDELARHGLGAGDLSEPFSTIILGDVSPSIEV